MTREIIVVKQLPVIEEQLRSVKAEIESRIGAALSLACAEDTYKEVKKVRAELNNEFKEMETRRKEVKAAIFAPYEKFDAIYKECVGDVYAAADAKLKARIGEVEQGLRSQRAAEAERFFNEYRESVQIPADLVSFGASGIKITLSGSRKSVLTSIRSFLDGIVEDLALIETQEHKEEILVEYRKTMNVSQAITATNERRRAIAAERVRWESLAAEQAVRAQAQEQVEQAKSAQALAPPIAVTAPPSEQETEKQYAASFRVIGTREQLRALKHFLEEGEFHYENI